MTSTDPGRAGSDGPARMQGLSSEGVERPMLASSPPAARVLPPEVQLPGDNGPRSARTRATVGRRPADRREPAVTDELVSVIVPARNEETEIGRTLDALRAQDY